MNLNLKNDEDNWQLNIKRTLKLSKNSLIEYNNQWYSLLKNIKFKKDFNILIIGGGSQILSNIILNKELPYNSITIIDPLALEYLNFSEVLETKEEDIQLITSSLDIFIKSNKNKYDLILIDHSQEKLKNFYTIELLDQLLNILKDNSNLIMYIPEYLIPDKILNYYENKANKIIMHQIRDWSEYSSLFVFKN